MTYETEIKAGAAFLDSEYPGWRDIVDWYKLDMFGNCILDQVYGDYGDAVKTLSDTPGAVGPDSWQDLHGFNATDRGDGINRYHRLTEAWKKYVNK